MDYTYLEELLHDVADDHIEFINKLERICEVLNVALTDDKNNYKNMGDFMADITLEFLKYLRAIGKIKF
jgi:hypothetical protein